MKKSAMRKNLWMLCIGLVFVLAGCKAEPLVAISGENFTKIAEAMEFTVEEVGKGTRQEAGAADLPEGIVQHLVADNGNYQIEYVQFADMETAREVYAGSEAGIQSIQGGASSYKTATFPEYAYLYMKAGGEYYSLSQAQNTLVCVVAPVEYKSEVQSLVKAMGY